MDDTGNLLGGRYFSLYRAGNRYHLTVDNLQASFLGIQAGLERS